jgi:CHAT domain-containing protein
MPEVGIPPRQLSNLPGAEAEAKKIANFLKTRPLIGAEATKQRVLSQLVDANLVHIATHGLLDNFGYDTPGAIALAPTHEDNGLLTAGEIINLELKANLVVLSACNTGQGDIRGDGVVGLSRALLTAGSTSVIVSLWAVPDEPTAALMEEFYRLLAKDVDRAQALRQAMLKTKERYPDPLNWAAFTLIGES